MKAEDFYDPEDYDFVYSFMRNGSSTDMSEGDTAIFSLQLIKPFTNSFKALFYYLFFGRRMSESSFGYIPRSKEDQVFSGCLYLIDELNFNLNSLKRIRNIKNYYFADRLWKYIAKHVNECKNIKKRVNKIILETTL